MGIVQNASRLHNGRTLAGSRNQRLTAGAKVPTLVDRIMTMPVGSD